MSIYNKQFRQEIVWEVVFKMSLAKISAAKTEEAATGKHGVPNLTRRNSAHCFAHLYSLWDLLCAPVGVSWATHTCCGRIVAQDQFYMAPSFLRSHGIKASYCDWLDQDNTLSERAILAFLKPDTVSFGNFNTHIVFSIQ